MLETPLDFQAEKPLTEDQKKQIEKFRKSMMDHYESMLPFLRLQAEHDGLLAEISEAHIRKVVADSQYAKFVLDQKSAKEAEGKDKPKENPNGEISKS